MTKKATTLSPEALEFAPGLLAIQESPPARLPRALLYAVSALVAILLVWVTLGHLDIIASAEGKLVPQTYVKIVQPADAGIVQEILVKEGEAVKAGQVLIRMDTQVAKADQKAIEIQLAFRALQLRRIDAELAGVPLLRKPDDPEDIFRQLDAQYRDHRLSYQDAVDQAQEALRKAQRDYEAGTQVLSKLKEVTPIFKTQADAYVNLGKNGYAAQVMVRDKEREYLEKARDLRAQEEVVSGLAASVAQASKQVNQITSRYRSELQDERVEAEGQYRRLQQEQVKQQHKTDHLELKAPQPGIVKDLATHTVGTVVSPGTVILSLVPETEPLIAEVMVNNDDIGFVFPQQQVKIKLSAYPFQKYGMLEGQVIHVGPDASDGASPQAKDPGKEAGPSHLTYKALVALKSQTLESQGQSFKLVPGMQVIAEIHQGRRTVLEYLLSPVQKTLHDGGRER